MRRLRFMLAGVLALALAVPAEAARPTNHLVKGLPVYLAMGDSIAAGEGASNRATLGNVPLFHAFLQVNLECSPGHPGRQHGCKHLQLLNIARSATAELPGVTTDSVMEEQLPVALPLLEARNGDANPRNDIDVVTLVVGGNDIFEGVVPACFFGTTPEQCEAAVVTTFSEFASDYTQILTEVRAAAGDATIIGMTYYNPIPYCELGQLPGAPQLSEILLEGGAPQLAFGLNDLIRVIAASNGALVAEASFGLLGASDLIGGSDCRHPNDSGHAKIAAAFEEAFDAAA